MSWSDPKLEQLLAKLGQADLAPSDRIAAFRTANSRLARLAKRYHRAVDALEQMGQSSEDEESDDELIPIDDLSGQIEECLRQMQEQTPIAQIIPQVERISKAIRKQSGREGALEIATADLKLRRLDLASLLEP